MSLNWESENAKLSKLTAVPEESSAGFKFEFTTEFILSANAMGSQEFPAGVKFGSVPRFG